MVFPFMMQPSLFLFSFFLMFSLILTMGSSSWFIMWSGLEINTISFISWIYEENNKYSSESCFKYFFVQAISSIMLIFFSQPIMNLMNNLFLINMALLFKLGAAPFHLWFISMMQSIKWIPCLILSTIQKLIPMSILFYYSLPVVQIFASLSAILGSLGGLNQTNLKTLIAYSSIVHLGWMLSTVSITILIWPFYWSCYLLMSVSIIMMLKMTFMLSPKTLMSLTWSQQFLILFMFLSLGGLPPLFGFLPKWFLLNFLTPYSPTISFILIMSSILNLYFYIRMFYIPMMHSSPSYKINFHLLVPPIHIFILLSLTSLTLPLFPILK
uniref:NADH dehydrogenase subunit 1 n=1 Tax=Heptathela kimurai TaxID=88333 RepID=UPI0031F346FB